MHTISWLRLAFTKVNRATVNACGCAGFQAALRQLQFFESRRQRQRRRIARPARRVVLQTDVYLAVQKSARCQHYRLGTKANTHLRHRAHHPVAFHHQVVHSLLKQPQVGLVFQHAANGGFVQHPVGLRPRGAHGRAFAAIENAKLDAAFVRGQRHRAAQCVHFFDQMALANAANRRVAAHLAQGFYVVGQQQGFAAHAGSSQRGFGARVPATDDDHVKNLGVVHSKLNLHLNFKTLALNRF